MCGSGATSWSPKTSSPRSSTPVAATSRDAWRTLLATGAPLTARAGGTFRPSDHRVAVVRRVLHPSAGMPLRRRDKVDDVLRAQCAAHEVLAQDAAPTAGISNVRPIRHLHAVYNWADDEEAET